jgi:hypothetical protein
MTDVAVGVRIVHLPGTSLRYALREPTCRGLKYFVVTLHKVWSYVAVTECAKTVTGSVVIRWNVMCGDSAPRITVTLTREEHFVWSQWRVNPRNAILLWSFGRGTARPQVLQPSQKSWEKISYLNASFRYDIRTCFKSMWVKSRGS